MNIFGEKLEGVTYNPRPGAYAIILENGKTAAVKTSTGYFLPGGGIEENENYEECLKRECLEEIGFKINILDFVGRAKKYFYSTTRFEYMVSDGYFYFAELIGEQQKPTEEDHELVWIRRNEAKDLFFLEHQAWAVEKAFEVNFKF